MKINILMARGLEGCGVTKFSLEHREWLVKHGHEVNIIYAKDKAFTRNRAHNYKDVTIPVSLADDYDKTLSLLNACDILIINSVPAINAPEAAIDNYKKLVENIKPEVRVVVYQHDHRALSLRRNAGLEETVKRADVLFSHSSNGDFNTVLMEEYFPSGGLSFFDDSDSAPPVYNFQPAMNIKAIRDKYWKDFSAIDFDIHRWIGRTTTWKGYFLMFDFHESHLRPAGKTTILEGLERSPAFINIKERYEIDYCRHYHQVKTGPGLNPQVLDRYVNSEMLERMSQSGFGYQLSRLPDKFLERSLEYTHLELGACGTIPVFHKATGDALKFRVDGKPLTSHDSGILWLNDENKNEVFERMKHLSSDRKLYDKERNKAYEFLVEHQDSEHCFKEQFELMTK
ncbi:hypothetical protein [Klebsiella phage JY1]|nr:hypothetical protein [Klebsiella phage JY1]